MRILLIAFVLAGCGEHLMTDVDSKNNEFFRVNKVFKEAVSKTNEYQAAASKFILSQQYDSAKLYNNKAAGAIQILNIIHKEMVVINNEIKSTE